MTPEEIIAIINLVATLEPTTATLINNLVTSFNSSSLTIEDKLKQLDALTASLKQITPKA